MKQILKNFSPHWKSIILIVMFLFVQAFCDLALPQYTSNIIDVGIQNGGMEHIVPDRITKEEYEGIKLYMNEAQLSRWEDIYTEKEEYYKLKKLSKNELEELDDVLLIPILTSAQFEAMPVSTIKDMLWNNSDTNKAFTSMNITKEMLDEMPTAQLSQMLGMEINTFEKEISSGNDVVVAECVNMNKIISNLPKEMLQNMDFTSEDANKSFQEIIDTMGSKTAQSMGKKWAVERNVEAGIDGEKYQMHYLWIAGFKMLLMTLIMGLSAIAVGFFASRVGAGIGRDLRHKVFHKVIGFSNKEMDQFSTASLITRCTNDVQQVQMVSVLLLRMVLYAPIVGIGGVIKVINTGAGMGWIIALAVILIMGFVMVLMSITMPKFKMMQKLVDRLNLVSREILTGLSVIRAFGREQTEEKRFDVANKELMSTQLFTNRVMSFMMPGMMTIMYAINILIVWTAAHKIDKGLLQVGSMTAFITYAMLIVMSFLMLTMLSIFLPRAGVAADRIKEVLDTEYSISDMENAECIEKKTGVVEFKNVAFRYPNANENAIEGINFKAEPGKTTAIIGSTGCGKSTLVNLIPRLYDVTEGEILIDGHNIKNLKMEEVRDMIGLVPQKGVLFSGTIESNLKFAGETVSDKDMQDAAEIAQAMEFIDNKEDKFKSNIAQGGGNVSGGQKQRLAIARAIAKKPPVLIFDDSFSALDMKTDAKLRKALAEKVSKSTLIIVAQRISTILKADQIIVLDDGKIVGMGTHKELLDNCEVYQQIATSQLSAKELGLEGGNK